MPVDNLETIDIVSSDDEGNTVLIVSDHLEWDDASHLLTLQKKLNLYLRFIESGEVFEKYPDARGKKVIIEVVTLFEPDAIGTEFLRRAGAIIEGAGFGFSYRQRQAS